MIEARQWVSGQKITEPGLYAGVPIGVYHGGGLCDGPSVSSSALRRIFRSPAHYWATSPYNPDRVEEEETAALLLGRAAHHLFLGEADFHRQFIARPETLDGEKWNGNRKACKAWLGEQELKGLQVLKPDQIESIRGMAVALAQDPLVRAGILNGLIEHTIVYKDPDTGLWVQVRPDAIPNHSGDFGDLKVTTDVRDDALERTIGDYGYHQQGALIGDASYRTLNIQLQSFNLVFVEGKAPNCVRTVAIEPKDLELGAEQNGIAMKIFKRCMETGVWPGPGGTQQDARHIGLKPWTRDSVKRQIEELQRELAA